eukprot:3076577-Pyramimonas_sp.AAC.1
MCIRDRRRRRRRRRRRSVAIWLKAIAWGLPFPWGGGSSWSQRPAPPSFTVRSFLLMAPQQSWDGSSSHMWRCERCGCSKTMWNQAHCKHCGAHWKTGEEKWAKKGKGTDREGWDRDQLGDSPPGLGGMAPLPVGAQTGGKDPVPDLSVDE